MKKLEGNQVALHTSIIKGNDYYAFRIKNIEQISKLKMKKLNSKLNYQQVLVSLEQGTDGQGLHYHGLVGDNPDKISRNILRAQLKEIYPDMSGNKHYSISRVKDVKQCTKYTLKEGEFVYKGFDPEFIRIMFKASNKKEKLREKIIFNEEQLISEQITYKQFKINYIQIKVDHGQNLYNTHIQSYFNRFKIKSGEMTAAKYVDTFFDRDLFFD